MRKKSNYPSKIPRLLFPNLRTGENSKLHTAARSPAVHTIYNQKPPSKQGAFAQYTLDHSNTKLATTARNIGYDEMELKAETLQDILHDGQRGAPSEYQSPVDKLPSQSSALRLNSRSVPSKRSRTGSGESESLPSWAVTKRHLTSAGGHLVVMFSLLLSDSRPQI